MNNIKHYIIDRFEENYAVCESEDRCRILVLREELPKGAREGDALISKEGQYFIVKKTFNEQAGSTSEQ